MSRTVANLVRAATIVVFAVVAVLVVRMFLDPGTPDDVPPARAGEVPVDRAIAVATDRPLVVRGRVFDGPGGLGLRLCQGRQATVPPLCLGPYLDLDLVNEGSFSLRRGQTDDGEVRWAEEPVALRGTIVGTRMTVSEILR